MNSLTINVSWDTLKSFCVSKSIPVQYLIVNDYYRIFVIDGPLILNSQIQIDTPANVDQLDFETNFKPYGNKPIYQNSQQPFAAKTFGAKKLYKRFHGIQSNVIIGSNTIEFVIPYAWIKITDLEIVNGTALDTVSVKILDTATGTYSTVPNYTLNQFAFDANVSKDLFVYRSEFDADLYTGMRVQITYTSVSIKTIGINFILNEVK